MLSVIQSGKKEFAETRELRTGFPGCWIFLEKKPGTSGGLSRCFYSA
jgi:hypothetical protein